MRACATIEEVKLYIGWAFEFLEKSKKIYTIKQIDELESKFHKKYYSPFAISDSHNYKIFVKWRSMQYLKHIMHYQGVVNTGLVSKNVDIEEMAGKIQELTVREEHCENLKDKKGLK